MLTKLIDHFDSLKNIRICLKDLVRDKSIIPKVPQIRSRFKYLCTIWHFYRLSSFCCLKASSLAFASVQCSLNVVSRSLPRLSSPACCLRRTVTHLTGQPALLSWVLKTAKERVPQLLWAAWAVWKFPPMSSLNLPTCCCKIITSCYYIICLYWEEFCSITWIPTHQLAVGLTNLFSFTGVG